MTRIFTSPRREKWPDDCRRPDRAVHIALWAPCGQDRPMSSRVLKNSRGYRAWVFWGRGPGIFQHPAGVSLRRFGLALLVAGSVWLAPAAAGAQSGRPSLPTPPEHYDEYDLRSAALALVPRVAPFLDAATMQRLMGMAGGDWLENAPQLTPEEITAIIDGIDLEPIRIELIELLIHGSSVLDMVPEGDEDWIPIVHDSFLTIMSGMSIDRIRNRVVGQVRLPPDAGRGQRLLAFGAETPTFQKIGQILARYPWVPDDLAAALVTLESDIVTIDADELVAIIRDELGEQRLREYRFEFEDEVLSEASVGAIMGATMIMPGEQERRRVVVKIIKSHAVAAIDEDLEGINTLLGILEDNGEFYGFGGTPLVDMFREVRAALAQEVRSADERAHLAAAAQYFAANPRVLIPALCPCSSANVTVMQRMEGGKVTDAYVDDPEKRTGLARRLTDIMMYDVMFAPGDSLFHGDPHAGNVFSSPSDDDPYRISLLDWGLQGHLSREQKGKLLQVGLGLQLKHAERLRNNMDVLIDDSIDPVADRETIDGVIDRVFEEAEVRKRDGGEPGALDMLDALVSELGRAGYVVDGDLLLYVKSLYTIIGVIGDLDPDFVPDEHVSGRVSGQVLKEMPKRLVNTIWIPGMWSHDYPSMASNNDVWARQLNSIGRGFKAVGVGFWKGISFPFRGRGSDSSRP